ncbi:hypothetical protein [Polynucleobacter sp. 73C-SIWE]|nr:hypothetical protein [Polynucleobacter sp. 73C-SIWE]
MDDMFLPTTHDIKDAVSKYAGFFGMVISITIVLNLILPTGETLSNTPKLIVSLLISIFLGWLSFAIKSNK